MAAALPWRPPAADPASGKGPGGVPSRGALRIDGVGKCYGSGPSRVVAVDGCSIDVPAGEVCVVVGPSGCGKTTLLHAIAGFTGVSAGSIHLDGRLLCGPAKERAEVGPDRAVVFQHGALFPWRTNLENVAFGPWMTGALPRAQALSKANAMLADAGLRGHEHEYPGASSSGVRRRVEILRALINEPAVLLLDEPFRALDALTKSMMHEALLAMHARTRGTVFFITHDLEEAVFLGTRVAVMTSRPCRTKRVVAVDLPFPRGVGLSTSRRFRELVAEVTAVVRDEVRQADERGEREG